MLMFYAIPCLIKLIKTCFNKDDCIKMTKKVFLIYYVISNKV